MDKERYFSVEDANKTLPLVSRIMEDIMNAHEEWRKSVSRYELLAGGRSAEDGETEEMVAIGRRVDDLAREIEGYIKELSDIGCMFKGFENGLVDFLHKKGGRDVLLCWQYGESAVSHWHEMDAGFSGRRPLAGVGEGSDD
ncbi:MAG: DUF2203 domain-containing protein [Gemmatimonadota bacterium]|nr:DUF2203 domain-containing protein [Gemmatimonadota bacterium]MDH5804682.1 DUF2203 domain-containing protein [Gemmatimonadota bacterium]